MSRSRRKMPIFGHSSAKSDAEWKAKAARKLRKRQKQHLEQTLNGDGFAGKRWEGDDPWTAPKDGKFYWVKVPSKFMRK
jgi:hypothetical protein